MPKKKIRWYASDDSEHDTEQLAIQHETKLAWGTRIDAYVEAIESERSQTSAKRIINEFIAHAVDTGHLLAPVLDEVADAAPKSKAA